MRSPEQDGPRHVTKDSLKNKTDRKNTEGIKEEDRKRFGIKVWRNYYKY